MLPLIVSRAIDAAPAHRGDEWKGAAAPRMPDQLPHVAVEGGLVQRFLAGRFPKPIVHTTVPTQQFLLRLIEPLMRLEAEKLLLHADHIHFASGEPGCWPNYARGNLSWTLLAAC